MASPHNPPTQTTQASHPLTPPAEPSSSTTTSAAAHQQQQLQATTTSTTVNGLPPNTSLSTIPVPLPPHPATSHTDSGTSKRPRDARLIHLILTSLSVSAYQERVPLQLLDFAYRYTSSVLGDAAHVQAEGWDTGLEGGTTGGGKKGVGAKGGGAGGGGGVMGGGGGGGVTAGGPADREEVSLASLRIAIGSRMQYQYQGSLPKEFLMGLARDRNRVGLGVGRGGLAGSTTAVTGGGAAGGTSVGAVQDVAGQIIGGVKLPPEKYCLNGVGWGVREEWDSEGEEDLEGDGGEHLDQMMGLGGDGPEDEMEGLDEDGEAAMEDIFGHDGGGGAAGGGEDENMQDG